MIRYVDVQGDLYTRAAGVSLFGARLVDLACQLRAPVVLTVTISADHDIREAALCARRHSLSLQGLPVAVICNRCQLTPYEAFCDELLSINAPVEPLGRITEVPLH